MAHFNPMLLYMWIGGALLLLGVVYTLWPDRDPYPVFAAARKKRTPASTAQGEWVGADAQTATSAASSTRSSS